jgi:hypothetical protein
MRGSAYGLGGLTIGAQEAAAHSFPVHKSGFPGNFLDRQPTMFEQVASGLESKILDGARRRLTGFHSQQAGELPGAWARRLGKLLDSKGRAQILLRKGERVLDAIGFRIELKQGRML